MSRPFARLVLLAAAVTLAACSAAPTAPTPPNTRAVKPKLEEGYLPPCDSTNRRSDVEVTCRGGSIPWT